MILETGKSVVPFIALRARVHRIAIQMIEAIYYFGLFCPTIRVYH